MLDLLKGIFLYPLEKRVSYVMYYMVLKMWNVLFCEGVSAISLEVLKERLSKHLLGIPMCLYEVRIIKA